MNLTIGSFLLDQGVTYLETQFFHVTVDRTSNVTLNNMLFEKLRI
jgi:hypothetical protein